MKVLAVPNSFKGSRSSIELCDDLRAGFLAQNKDIDFVSIPVADGGDGFLVSIVEALNGEYIEVDTVDALNRPIKAKAGIANGHGIIEMALASGLAILDESELNPLKASSYGTGLIIQSLLSKGINNIVLGIGGSATNDGGMGCLAALGYKFLDKMGNALYPSGESLEKIAIIDSKEVLPQVLSAKITVVCDVNNPLTGTDGASYVYAPQKGATPEMVKRLDEGLKHYAHLIHKHTGSDFSKTSGSGAAGGIGFGLMSLANATLKSGVDTVLELCEYEKYLEGADLVITGEGRLDEQTKQGKLPMGVGIRAMAKSIPCVAICGYSSISAEELKEIGIIAVYALIDIGKDVDYCIKNADVLTKELASVIYKDFFDK